MWLSILLLCLLLGVFVVQSTHGLYSTLIMTVLTVCCAAAAFGTFEWVAINWLSPVWRRDYSFALALALTFGVPLLLLRVAADQMLRRTCLVPMWLDRVGGAACGFVTAMLIVGVIATCLQLIPFNNTILGFSRFPIAVRETRGEGPASEPPDPKAKETNLWLKPDRFAVAVASMLSDGVFSGRRSFAGENPDFIQAIGWLNTTNAEVSRYAPPRSISVVRTRPLQLVYRYTPGNQRTRTPPNYELERPKPNHEFQMVRVALKRGARDRRKSHVFALHQFRLVGSQRADAPLQQYHAMAIQRDNVPDDAEDTTEYHISKRHEPSGDWPVTCEVFAPRDGNNDEVEVVFEVPRGFVPRYIEYKRGARAALTFATGRVTQEDDARAGALEESASTGRAATDAGSEGRVADSARTGGAAGFSTGGTPSFFGSNMPVTMTSYRRLKDAAISRGALVNGHLLGFAEEQALGSDTPVSKFRVPRNKRLLHLSTKHIQARSTLGRALSFAIRTVQNYTVQDAGGQRYKVIGKYAIADVSGREVIEVQYFRDHADAAGGLGKFEMITDRHLTGDYRFVLLFLVDPGAHIVSFTTGGAASREENLTGENLTAPD